MNKDCHRICGISFNILKDIPHFCEGKRIDYEEKGC